MFTVPYTKAFMYQLFLSIKGLKTVADKSLAVIGTTEICMRMAGNTFLICVEMGVCVIMSFLR